MAQRHKRAFNLRGGHVKDTIVNSHLIIKLHYKDMTGRKNCCALWVGPQPLCIWQMFVQFEGRVLRLFFFSVEKN